MTERKCKFCKHYFINPADVKQGSCHYNPPTAVFTVLPSKSRLVKDVRMMWQSSFTPVSGDQLCGKFEEKPKLGPFI